MKIGILTFQNTLNYGALLQAYALQETLSRMGNVVEIIDYINSRVAYRETPQIPSVHEWIKHPRGSWRFFKTYRSLSTRKNTFDRFATKYLSLSTQMVKQSELSEAYDVVVVGSDQIWNLGCTGNDLFYFLGDLDRSDTKTISYAASFGSGVFSEDYQKQCASALKKFDAISVRESSGQEIISELIGKNVPLVLDPTLLLEKSDWEMLTAPSAEKTPYVFAYIVSERKETIKFAKKLAKRNQAQLVLVDCYNGCTLLDKGRYRNSVSPEEFLSLISQAQCVVTSSYHGLALSLALQKEVYYALSSKAGNRNSRLETLAALVGIQHRNISGQYSPQPLDYCEINKRLSLAREESLGFLETNL